MTSFPAYYEGTFKGVPFSRHWAVMKPQPDGGYQLEMFLELDPKPLGQGGSPIRQRSRAWFDAAHRPLRHESEARGARAILEVRGDEVFVTLPDGSTPKVPLGGAEMIVESNMTGLTVLLFERAFAAGRLAREASFTLFLLNKLMAIPYRLTPAGERRYRSTFEEDIELDEHGVLLTSAVPKHGVAQRRVEPVPPLPAWATESLAPTAAEVVRYHPPADATFRLEDVTIDAPGGALGGTLTVPAGTGPSPAVIFLSGTGAHDRHGIAGEIDLGSHEIVDYLSQRGFVGLRYDTRGAGTTRTGEALDASVTRLVDDARAAWTWLCARPEVDRTRVFLLGHSQGGTIALSLDEPVRGVALLASLGRPIDQLLEEQIDARSREVGLSDEQREAQLAEYRELVAAVRAGRKFAAGEVPDRLVPYARMSDWLRYHIDHPPAELVAKARCPVLICQGAKDIQVRVRDADLLYDAARAAGVRVEREVFPALDHLFKPVAGESKVTDYYDRSRHVDATFLARLLAWLQACASA